MSGFFFTFFRGKFEEGRKDFVCAIRPDSGKSGELDEEDRAVGPETLLEYRPLAARYDVVGDVFRVQGELRRYFREYLRGQRFTEIITSKIVASGTEGGTNLFYKEYGVAGFERAYETGHVYSRNV